MHFQAFLSVCVSPMQYFCYLKDVYLYKKRKKGEVFST